MELIEYLENPDWKPMRYHNKTVYILGAGFSEPIGTPMLHEFIPKALRMLTEEAQKKPKDRQLKNFLKDLSDMLGSYMLASAHRKSALVNLEDLFCMVDLRASANPQSPSHKKDHKLLTELILRTFRMAYQKHMEAIRNGDAALAPTVPRRYLHPGAGSLLSPSRQPESLNVCIYHAFLSQLMGSQKGRIDKKSLNVVITFNYDLLIECKLEAFKDVCVYYGEKFFGQEKYVSIIGSSGRNSSQEPLKYLNHLRKSDLKKAVFPLLKLHGSLNWRFKDGKAQDELEDVATLYPDADTQRKSLSRIIEHIRLVPPTWRKGSDEGDVYEKLMGQADVHLKEAGKIVIVGYSMPPTDGYFRYLIADAMCTPDPPLVEVWDVRTENEMRERIVDMFGPLIGPQVKYNSSGFEGLVQSFKSDHSLGPA